MNDEPRHDGAGAQQGERMTSQPTAISSAGGTLGVLLPGMGAVATTFMAGVEAVRRGIGQPFGSLTQMGTIRLGGRPEKRVPKIKDFVPIAGLDQLVFGAWDVFPDDACESARNAGVLESSQVEELADFLRTIRPMRGAFDQRYVKKLNGTHIIESRSKRAWADQLIDDIERFREANGCDRVVMVWCGSTEVFLEPTAVHQDIDAFEKGLDADDDSIPPSMIYAYAALKCGIPYANGAPNLSADVPALLDLAAQNGVPVSGKDFKTGQTLMKTILAPGFKARMLGIGEVLDDPESFKTKEESKLGVLDFILQPELYPELYGDISHVVRINYYPPRGDNKEGWDNIDIFGWLGYPMQIKINFLCRDSILAAPIVLDLVLFLDLAARAGMTGIQEWLSFYWKSPMHAPKLYPEHDIFIQLTKLKNTLRFLMGEEQITHLGLEYYQPPTP
jgi:myo-inositol-1-phosphate synthase